MAEVVDFRKYAKKQPQKIFKVYKVVEVTTLGDYEEEADATAHFNLLNGLNATLPCKVVGTMMIVEGECEEA